MVGRDRPVAQLRAEVERNLASHGGLVFVTGEAGIGKTTLVGEALGDLDRSEAWLVHGTCWDREGAPGYWPWVQVVRSLARSVDAPTWEDARAQAGGDLTVLLGEATHRPGGRVPGDDGFGVADAVTTLLITLSRNRPLIVVLEDLQWADGPSVRVLEFAARHGWFEQLLIVGTFRDDEVRGSGHPLRPSLPNLASKATTISLTGLDRSAVAELLSGVTGDRLPHHLEDEVHRRTGGNPFFVDQTAQIWATTGTIDAVPPQVRDAVDRRLGLLSPELSDLLGTAAVLGPDFTADLLSETAGTAPVDTGRLLQEAAAARLLAIKDHNQGTWSFSHDLVRDTLYCGLAPDEARRRHAAAFGALGRAAGSGVGHGETVQEPAALRPHVQRRDAGHAQLPLEEDAAAREEVVRAQRSVDDAVQLARFHPGALEGAAGGGAAPRPPRQPRPPPPGSRPGGRARGPRRSAPRPAATRPPGSRFPPRCRARTRRRRNSSTRSCSGSCWASCGSRRDPRTRMGTLPAAVRRRSTSETASSSLFGQ
jgi:hypothetical protein